uniref:E2 ubiquitin-conjugating enzyme n=1 Tax=Macrostomum lignano TaxID=282301 RepID=A0A1I8GCS3_9PLAT
FEYYLRAPSHPPPQSSAQSRGARLDALPTELILAVLAHCDDMAVWSLLRLGNRRLTQIIEREFSDAYWQRQLSHRWPLFTLRRPLGAGTWRSLYSDLLLSAPCLACLASGPSSWDVDEASSWRQRRLRLEYRSLIQEPPYGVAAVPTPVDSGRLSQWHAVICGPPGSPYQGGAFFLSLTVPHSYPLRPPLIRFLTKVFHPNVSRHGDVGLDAILPTNWSLALTLAKVLVCVQSLLTDPYTEVSMEPRIARLCIENRPEFERLARLWTWKYAMHDFVGPLAATDEPAGDGGGDL